MEKLIYDLIRIKGSKEFESFEEFVQWYKKRPHGALKLEQLESLQDALLIDYQLRQNLE